MYPLKVSVDLLKVTGAKVLAVKNVNGLTEYVVAVPCKELFIPKERNAAHLMLNGIPTPNSPYGDFMMKPFIKSEDYQLLSKQEKEALPIMGKAVFMKVDSNKAAAAMAETASAAVVESASISDVMSSVGDGFSGQNPDPSLAFGNPV